MYPLTHFASLMNLIALPGQCKDITSSDVTKNSCKISWEAPEDDGGTPIVSYTLERREASKKTYMPVMSGENVLTFTVKDLYINCEYYFRVKALNKVGAGEYLELRNPVIIEEIKRKPFSAKCYRQLMLTLMQSFHPKCWYISILIV